MYFKSPNTHKVYSIHCSVLILRADGIFYTLAARPDAELIVSNQRKQ